jgi:hypothetical protein
MSNISSLQTPVKAELKEKIRDSEKSKRLARFFRRYIVNRCNYTPVKIIELVQALLNLQ